MFGFFDPVSLVAVAVTVKQLSRTLVCFWGDTHHPLQTSCVNGPIDDEQEEDEFQDCLTVIEVESSAANAVTIPTILTTEPSGSTPTTTAGTSWRRLRGVLSAAGAAREIVAEKQGLCPPGEFSN